jgi:hypothetical protein
MSLVEKSPEMVTQVAEDGDPLNSEAEQKSWVNLQNRQIFSNEAEQNLGVLQILKF